MELSHFAEGSPAVLMVVYHQYVFKLEIAII